jgi:hypothetical protein
VARRIDMKNGIMLGLILALGAAGSAAQQQQRILKPVPVQDLAVRMAKPNITEVRGKCLSMLGELDVMGVRFGEIQGSREVVLNGIPRDVMFWQKTVIRVQHGYDFPGGQMVKVFLRDTGNGAIVSNIFEFFNLFCIYWNSPIGSVSPGTSDEIKVKPGMGAGAQGRVIVIGGKQAPILAWTNDTIKFTVPALSPGDYNIHIKKAGQNLSNEYPITVK